jgi:UDP-N-acetylglucosamine 2-epimerase (non-hydrolysing)
MIDALEMSRPRWERSDVWVRLGLRGPYAVLTLHRPANVDEPARLVPLLETIEKIARRIPVVFPVHPRVRSHWLDVPVLRGRIASAAAPGPGQGVLLIDPLGYLDFVALLSRARLVLTDSGGIQEETTFLGVPCLTLRDSTERPITVSHGTNRVIGTDPSRILEEAHWALDAAAIPRAIPPLWDGSAARRIVRILVDAVGGSSGPSPARLSQAP